MNTETNYAEIAAEAFNRIGTISTNIPINSILTELQLVVERLTFSKLYERSIQHDDSTMAEIELFFGDAVSHGMVAFIRWIAEQNALALLGGDWGRIFLDRCITEYRKAQEIEVVSAIDLSDEHRADITQRLREIYPEPARILFSTFEPLIAGFTIKAGNTVIDRSLRNHVASVVPRWHETKESARKSGGGNG